MPLVSVVVGLAALKVSGLATPSARAGRSVKSCVGCSCHQATTVPLDRTSLSLFSSRYSTIGIARSPPHTPSGEIQHPPSWNPSLPFGVGVLFFPAHYTRSSLAAGVVKGGEEEEEVVAEEGEDEETELVAGLLARTRPFHPRLWHACSIVVLGNGQMGEGDESQGCAEEKALSRRREN